jgi:type I restriction enzyme M protein
MGAAEIKHAVLGLISLKCISDAFEEHHARLLAQKAEGVDPEDPSEYRSLNIFWVPPGARWPHLKAQAKQPAIGQLLDDAMACIERDNLVLKGVLPMEHAGPVPDKTRVGLIIDLWARRAPTGATASAKDAPERDYEESLVQFASAEGKTGWYRLKPLRVLRTLDGRIAPCSSEDFGRCFQSPQHHSPNEAAGAGPQAATTALAAQGSPPDDLGFNLSGYSPANRSCALRWNSLEAR